MIDRSRALLLVACSALLFLTAWLCCAADQSEAPRPPIPQTSASRPIPEQTFTKGPYIQSLTPTSVKIMWETTAQLDSSVLYRESKDADWKRVLDAPTSILHEAKITDLTPGTVYRYRTELRSDPRGAVQSAEARFCTPVERPESLRFVVYGDSRSDPQAHADLVNAILRREADASDFVVHTGDLVTDGAVFSQWDVEFFDPAKELLSRVPLYPVLGNHEVNSSHYFDLFALPGNERYYTLDLGPARLIFLDSNSPLTPDSEQYNWLQAQLPRSGPSWKFVICHHPPFTSGPHGVLDDDGTPKEKETRDLQDYVVPLLENFRVTMVLAGHDHLYERSVKAGVCYITTGGGGAPLYEPTHDPRQNPYSRLVVSSRHYCVIEVDPSTLRLYALTPDASLIDQFEIPASP